MEQIRQRFVKLVTEYRKNEGIETNRALATAWDLDEHHLSNVMNGHKQLTLSMVMAAGAAGIDLNLLVKKKKQLVK
jgi:plasmid maintenance system antidote protein VapI